MYTKYKTELNYAISLSYTSEIKRKRKMVTIPTFIQVVPSFYHQIILHTAYNRHYIVGSRI